MNSDTLTLYQAKMLTTKVPASRTWKGLITSGCDVVVSSNNNDLRPGTNLYIMREDEHKDVVRAVEHVKAALHELSGHIEKWHLPIL